MRATMASHHARIFHSKCVAAKVSLAQAADLETKKAVIDSQTEMLVEALHPALTTREHGESIGKNFVDVMTAVEDIGLPGDKRLTVINLLEQILATHRRCSLQDYSTLFQF